MIPAGARFPTRSANERDAWQLIFKREVAHFGRTLDQRTQERDEALQRETATVEVLNASTKKADYLTLSASQSSVRLEKNNSCCRGSTRSENLNAPEASTFHIAFFITSRPFKSLVQNTNQ